MNGNHDNSIRGTSMAFSHIGMNQSVPNNAPKSDVQAAVDRLSSAIAQLGDRAGLLHNRLSPVLSIQGPPSISAQTAQGASTVPLAEQLNRLAAEVDEIRNGTVQDVLDRLHV